MAILELFRESQITLEQESPLADLFIRWVGAEQGEIAVTDEFDAELEKKSISEEISDNE